MGRISAFLIGGAIGAGVALAFTPKTGEEFRALVTEKVNVLAGEAKGFSENLPGSAQDAYKVVREQGASLIKDAQAKTSGIVGDAQSKVKEVANGQSETSSDELREKIEAARKRIAAQVMENAEKAKAAAEDVAEVEPDNTETAQ